MNNSACWLRDHHWTGRVRMVPSAVSLTDNGPLAYDDVWLVRPSYDGGVAELQNTSTGHVIKVQQDDVAASVEDITARPDGLAHGLVMLRRRPALRGAAVLWLTGLPTRYAARSGLERVRRASR